MKIYVLSTSNKLYSTIRILDEGQKRGHEMHLVNHTKCSIKIGEGKREIIFQEQNIIDAVDAIIPRIGTLVGRHGAAIVKEFEMNNVYSTARSLGILRAQNKVRTLQILNRKKLPIPNTVFAINPENIDEQISLLGGTPVIIKLQEGTQGLGVILAETRQSAKSIIDTFYKMNASILIQEYIKESNGEDIRVFVVGGQIIATMKRIGAEGDFRSNIHRGGTGVPAVLSKQEKKMAIKACQYLNLDVAGVDIIRSKKGPLIIEVNSSPGLKGIEHYTGINIAESIIKLIERKCEIQKRKTR